MAPSVLEMARNFEHVAADADCPRGTSARATARIGEDKAARDVLDSKRSSADSRCRSHTGSEEAVAPQLRESTSWESRPPSSPITSSSPTSSPARSRSPSPPMDGGKQARTLTPPSPVAPPGGFELRTPAQRMNRQDSDTMPRRMMSSQAAGVPRPRAMHRQWSQLSVATDNSESRRMSSFTRQMRFSRKDSTDSLMSAASEPVSYSNNLYVASDIWLAEKKLDTVEGEIIHRQDEKARRRGHPKNVADAFGHEAESQNFSSRLVGMLWSNPVASNSGVQQQRRSQRPASHGRRFGRGGYQVKERGTVGKGGKFTAAPSPRMADNMPGAFPHVQSNMSVRPQYQTKEQVSGNDMPRKMMSYHVKEAAKKGSPARWLRRRVHRRAERKEMF